MPAVFKAPLRPDLVQFVHDQMALNKRQPYAVSTKAGHQTSAESWGTGRAVARIPRVRGGGTHRSGQGAYGNMCRGGHMFAPTKVWRKWHRRININQKRYAICSALAGSAMPALVMAKGHVIDQVPEIPLVVSDKIESYNKTKQAVTMLRSIKAWSDIEKAKDSKRIRAGKGKMRNRRKVQKLGPLIIYNKDNGLKRAFGNIPGIQMLNVRKLNLLRVAPGGKIGRFIIWTESAFKQLDKIFGTFKHPSTVKKGFHLPLPMMVNTDINAILSSEEVQTAIDNCKSKKCVPHVRQVKRNPLKHPHIMATLNPYSVVTKRRNFCISSKLGKKDLKSQKRKLQVK
ncbi:unnamed protein product [Gordionus sp. m RMFG-2023]